MAPARCLSFKIAYGETDTAKTLEAKHPSAF